MKIYRLKFETEILVECETEEEAEKIGHSSVEYEVRNGMLELFSLEELESENDLQSYERGSLPWRSFKRRDEPELTVDQILKARKLF
jgi:hypothetical protein